MSGRLRILLKIALAGLVLFFLLRALDPALVWEATREADLRWIAYAVLLLLPNMLLEGVEWRLLLRRVAPVGWGATFGGILCGYALGFFTPARAGEIAGRAFYLDGVDRWSVGATVVVQRLGDMFAALLFGLAAMALFAVSPQGSGRVLWWASVGYGAGIFTLLLLLFLFPAGAHDRLGRFRRARPVAEKLAFLQELSRARMAALLLAACARYLIYALQLVCLLFAFTDRHAWADAQLGAALVYFAKFLIPSVTMADLGVREGLSVYFFGALGFDRAAAFNASVFLFLLNLLVPAAIGLPFVLRLRFPGSREATAGPPAPGRSAGTETTAATGEPGAPRRDS